MTDTTQAPATGGDAIVVGTEPITGSAPATTQETAQDAPADTSEPADAVQEDPSLYEPAVSILHLERDGVVVEGPIDPKSGEGARALLDELKAQLKLGPEAQAKAPDPNLARRERAKAAGHVLNPDTGHCDKCNAANWWAEDGNPCEPRPPVPVEPAPATTEEAADGSQDT